MLDNEYPKQIANHIDDLITEFRFTAQKHKESQILNSGNDIFGKDLGSLTTLNAKQIEVVRNLLTFLSEDDHPIIEYTPVTFYVFKDGYDNHDIDDVGEAVSRAKNLVNFDSQDFASFRGVDNNTEYRYYKILDHISLAFVQAAEMRRLQKLIDESEEKLKEVNKGMEDIDKTQKYVEKQVSSIYPQFITILGIFTAIIVAFFGGVSLSNSLIDFNTFSSVESFITIGSIAAIFILTMLFMLMTWVDHILHKNVLKVKHTEVYFTAVICLAVFAIIGIILIAAT